MASQTVASSPAATSTDRARIRKKKKKAGQQSAKRDLAELRRQENQYGDWKSETQQQIYSSKLLKALRHVASASPSGGGSSSSSGGPRRGRELREAADRALAATAKGRSRWSRAILTSRLKLKFRKHKRPAAQRASSSSSSSYSSSSSSLAATGKSRSRRPRVSVYRLKGKSQLAVQRKARVLGRLVPGCRKQPFPVILEETFDYIEAKHMQIRAMTELINRLAGSSSSAGVSTSSPTTLI